MIVVAVVATAMTGGALAAPMAAALGSTTAGAIAAGAIAGAVGSIASQAVGIAIGAQDGFNWKGVALGAIGGGVAGGVTQVLGTATSIPGAVGRAMLTNTITQGVGIVTGLQNGFSWRSVAASAAGAAAGAQADQMLADSNAFASVFSGRALDIARGTVAGFVSGTSAALARGGKIEIARIATDAFGNALGSSLAEKMRPTPTQTIEPIRESLAATFADDVEQRISGNPIARALDKQSRREEAARILAEQASSDSGSASAKPYTTAPWLPEEARNSLYSLTREGGFTTYSAGVVQADDGSYMQYGKATYHRPVDNLYTPNEGFIQPRYSEAVAGFSNSNAPLSERGVYLGLATLALPGALLEGVGTGLWNAPNNLYRSVESARAAYNATDTDDKVLYSLEAIRDGANGITGLFGPFVKGPAPVSLESRAAAQSPSQWTAARETYNAPVIEAAPTRAPELPPFVFRGDSRAPDVIFNEGLQPRGTNVDLLEYAQYNEPSIYIPTSTSPNVARGFAKQQGGGYVYTVKTPEGGIDVNAALGWQSPFKHELEIAIPGGVSPAEILGARQVGPDGKFFGPFVKNPGYVPPK
jgi:hypothetical protein